MRDKNYRNVYEKLLSISSSFIFINKGRAINVTNNQTILKKFYVNIQDPSKLGNNDYLKACLFVINLFRNITREEMNMENVKKELSTILFDNPDRYEEINSVFLNAKNFYDYLNSSYLLQDHEALLNKFEKNYKEIDDDSFLKIDNFPKYCLQQIKQKVKDLGIKYDESQKCSPEFLKEIENIISEKMLKLNEAKLTVKNEENINKLAYIFYLLKDEEVYKEMNAYKNSYCEEFLKILKNQIEFSITYKDEEYSEALKNILKYFDIFFTKNVKYDVNILNFKIVSLQSLFEEAREDMEAQIKNYKDQAKIMINKGKSQEEIISTISKALDEIIKKII